MINKLSFALTCLSIVSTYCSATSSHQSDATHLVSVFQGQVLTSLDDYTVFLTYNISQDASQLWYFDYSNDDIAVLKHVASDLVLQVDNKGDVSLGIEGTDQQNQLWQFDEDGGYLINSQYGLPLVLSVKDENNAEGAQIHLEEKERTTSKKWLFSKVM